MKTLSIEQLAEKLQGNLWVKGDLKRIYLDRGYNTKKMTTKTYVYERDGQFMVSCNIDCPSQVWQWIKSQQQEVIDDVMNDIEEAIELLNVELVDSKLTEDKTAVEVLVSYNGEQAIWMTENEFYKRFNEYPENVFEGLPETVHPVKDEVPAASVELPKVVSTETPTFGEGKTINHTKFGNGLVLSEGDDKIEINFESVGVKQLLKKFCTLTLVD